MTKRIDTDRAAELRRTWEAKRKMWLTEAAKLKKLAKVGPMKFEANRMGAFAEAMLEVNKYEHLITELNTIINGDG